MAESNSTSVARLGELLAKLALELNFIEPGKDSGLLPINSFIFEAEDILRGQPAPPELQQAVQQARAWLNRILDTTAIFDAPTIARLGEWQAWMSSAATLWQNQQPCPGLPVAWSEAGASTSPQAGTPTPAPALTQPITAEEPALTLSLEADGELLREFINESQEHLQNIENGVLVLEDNPADADTLNSIFRAFHTFKGGSGFLNLTPIKNLAHELESLLDAARQHKLAINSGIIDVILQGGDTLKMFVAQICTQLNGTNGGQPIVVPTLQLIARVKAVLANPEEGSQESGVRSQESEDRRQKTEDRSQESGVRGQRAAGCRPAGRQPRAPSRQSQSQYPHHRRGRLGRFREGGHRQARQPHRSRRRTRHFRIDGRARP